MLTLTTLNLTDLALHNGAQQKTSELGAVVDYLRPFRFRTVVEIGSRKGGTLVLWMLMAEPDAMVVSLDLPLGLFGGGDFTAELQNAARFRQPAQQLHFVRGDSHAAQSKAEVVRLLGGRPVDLLFIDGDHTYEGVKQDYDEFGPLVPDGGLVLFHDVMFHNANALCRVDQFWNEVKVGKVYREFIDPNHTIGEGTWGGIGVLRVERAAPVPAAAARPADVSPAD